MIFGAPCARRCLHFLASSTGIFKSSVYNTFFKMQSSSLTNLAMFYLHSLTCKTIEFFIQCCIFILQSVKVAINLHLCLQAKIGIFKSSCKPPGSPSIDQHALAARPHQCNSSFKAGMY